MPSLYNLNVPDVCLHFKSSSLETAAAIEKSTFAEASADRLKIKVWINATGVAHLLQTIIRSIEDKPSLARVLILKCSFTR